MATIAEKRAWLRDNGHEPPARGRLGDFEAIYDQAHAGGDADWDLPGPGDMMADPDAEPETPLEPETPPKTIRSERSARRARPAGEKVMRGADGVVGRLFFGERKGKEGKAKPKGRPKPRISLENFTVRAYSTLGRMVRPMSPATGNCLQAQAAMAGVLLEDVAQGTIVDRLLQGPARAEDKLNKGFALVMPPLVVFAIEQNQAAVAQGVKTPQQGMMRHAFLMPVLRESLRVGLEVSEGFGDQIRERLEREAKFDAQIDELITLIFGHAVAEAEDVPEPEMAGASV